MGQVQTEFTSMLQSIEASPGVLAGSPIWKLVEPNSYGTYGSLIKKVSRQPISKNRQRRKGIVVELDSSVDFECDVTLEALRDYAEAFAFASASGGLTAPQHIASGAGFQSLAAVTGGYSHSALTTAIPTGRLVFARGFTNSIDNGLKVVDTGPTTTSTPTVGGGLTAETPTLQANATLDVCGVRGAVGDITMNASGNLTSTVLDFTTLGLVQGQFIKIGGAAAANQFATAAYNGSARVLTIAAGLLTLDKRSWTIGSADTGATKLIDIYFGQFVRNVAVDDARFLQRTYAFELALTGLQNPSGNAYLYPNGNYLGKLGFNLPLSNKAIMTPGFIGLDTPVPTITRASGAATPVLPFQTAGFGTSSDIARLSVRALTDTTTDLGVYWKKVDAKLDNGVTAEKVLAQLPAKYINVGLLQFDLDAQAVFTDAVLLSAVRNNDTLTIDWQIKNSDGGAIFDVPSFTLGDGKLDLPRYKTVLINEKCEAFQDSTLGYTIGVSLFPFLP